jgi:hypothetical protein
MPDPNNISTKTSENLNSYPNGESVLESSIIAFAVKYGFFAGIVAGFVSAIIANIHRGNYYISAGLCCALFLSFPILPYIALAKIEKGDLYLKYFWKWMKIDSYKIMNYSSGTGEGGFALLKLALPENKILKKIEILMITEKDMEIYKYLKMKSQSSPKSA